MENEFGVAMMNFTEHLTTLASAIAGHRDKLVNEHHFTEGAAEAMAIHVHMKMVEIMCMPAPFRR